jgi:hypothetical protein
MGKVPTTLTRAAARRAAKGASPEGGRKGLGSKKAGGVQPPAKKGVFLTKVLTKVITENTKAAAGKPVAAAAKKKATVARDVNSGKSGKSGKQGTEMGAYEAAEDDADAEEAGEAEEGTEVDLTGQGDDDAAPTEDTETGPAHTTTTPTGKGATVSPKGKAAATQGAPPAVAGKSWGQAPAAGTAAPAPTAAPTTNTDTLVNFFNKANAGGTVELPKKAGTMPEVRVEGIDDDESQSLGQGLQLYDISGSEVTFAAMTMRTQVWEIVDGAPAYSLALAGLAAAAAEEAKTSGATGGLVLSFPAEHTIGLGFGAEKGDLNWQLWEHLGLNAEQALRRLRSKLPILRAYREMEAKAGKLAAIIANSIQYVVGAMRHARKSKAEVRHVVKMIVRTGLGAGRFVYFKPGDTTTITRINTYLAGVAATAHFAGGAQEAIHAAKTMKAKRGGTGDDASSGPDEGPARKKTAQDAKAKGPDQAGPPKREMPFVMENPLHKLGKGECVLHGSNHMGEKCRGSRYLKAQLAGKNIPEEGQSYQSVNK